MSKKEKKRFGIRSDQKYHYIVDNFVDFDIKNMYGVVSKIYHGQNRDISQYVLLVRDLYESKNTVSEKVRDDILSEFNQVNEQLLQLFPYVELPEKTNNMSDEE